jgi:hypothetical protein
MVKGKKNHNEIELNSSNSLNPQEIGRHFLDTLYTGLLKMFVVQVGVKTECKIYG